MVEDRGVQEGTAAAAAGEDAPKVLKGRVALITGASEGLGAEIARHFAAAGARVAICARNHEKLAAVKESISAAAPGCRVLAQATDVSVPADVDRLFGEIARDFGTLDVVVNSAGVLGPMGLCEDVAWEEWVATVNTNLLGLVNITRHALPIFKSKTFGRLIALGGGGVSSPMPYLSAYAASKAAVARFVESIALEGHAFNIQANVVAPGVLKTRMMDQVLDAGPDKVGPEHYERMKKMSAEGCVPLSLAAELCVFLASDAGNGISGKIISANRDRWRDWPHHLTELAETDIYTLRRITGRERDMDWGDA